MIRTVDHPALRFAGLVTAEDNGKYNSLMRCVERTSSEYWLGLDPLPLFCYGIGSAILTVVTLEARETVGVYPMLSESEAWKAAELLGEGYDFSVTTRSTWSFRGHADAAFLESWNKLPLKQPPTAPASIQTLGSMETRACSDASCVALVTSGFTVGSLLV